MEIREEEIPIPWGMLALKLWGDESNPAILCFHGLGDNAGTFNRLIPLLPNHYFYIGVDLPGHGKSSRLPAHIPLLHTIDYLLIYKIVTEYFKRDRYIFMCHSYGGQIAILFAQMYPKKVEKLILLDAFHLFPIYAPKFRAHFQDRLDYTRLEDKLTDSPPKYSYEDALRRLREGRMFPITEEAAKELLERMIVPVGNEEYSFTIDPLLKKFINPIRDLVHNVDTLKHSGVLCQVLLIIASYTMDLQERLKMIDNYYKSKTNFIVKTIDAYHDVHNISPDIVAPHIINFLNMFTNKL